MTLQERFNLIPPCLRAEDGGASVKLDDCLLGSISYYIELLIILVGIAAFFYIIYAGIQMATAFGNESKYAAAKNTLLHAIIGIIIATLAYTIVSFVNSFFGVSTPKLYDSETGQQITNNPGYVSAIVALDDRDDPGNGELTKEELAIAETGTNGTSLSAGGKNVALYLLSDTYFRVKVVKKSGDQFSLTTRQLKDGRYWARAWGATTDIQGATLEIYETDPKTGYAHKKEVKIN